MLRTLLSIIGTFIPVTFAQDAYPPVICTGIFGCGAAPSDVLLTNTLPIIGTVLIQVAGGGAVIAIVIAGCKMVLANGDEGKVSSARQGIMYALAGLGIAITASAIVSFVTTEDFWSDASIPGLLASVVRIIMTLFNVAFALVVVIAGIRMIIANGKSDEFSKATKTIMWAVIGAIVINLAKVIVQAFLSLGL